MLPIFGSHKGNCAEFDEFPISTRSPTGGTGGLAFTFAAVPEMPSRFVTPSAPRVPEKTCVGKRTQT